MTDPNPDSAGLVAASADLDTRVAVLIDHLVERIKESVPHRLCAVVLGGSLARGQGVSVIESLGTECLLSDIDLYVVVSQSMPTDNAVAHELRTMVSESRYVLPPLDVGFVDPEYFKSIVGTVPAAQLASGHRVLYATAGFELVIPDAPATLDPDDALMLLHNRLAENLLTRRRDDSAAAFHDWKVWIDAPLALVSALGQYSPQRDEQLDRLAGLVPACPGRSRLELQSGMDVVRGLVAAMRSRSLPSGELQSMMRPAGIEAPSLQRWVELIYPAVLVRALGGSQDEALATVGDSESVSVLQDRWLRRRSWWCSLREARRWAPLAGTPITPWWRHGWGGSGPDRVYVSAARAWLGREDWGAPLGNLVSKPGPGEEPDAWVGQLWSQWIMGGNRS